MEDIEVYTHFNALFQDSVNRSFTSAPLLAHYTSIAVAEKILTENTVWFSNPLFMNDLEEVRFIINNGMQILQQNAEIKAAWKTDERYAVFQNTFNNYFLQFANEHSVDTYVFCLSEYDETIERDGLLSMWRRYGQNGNGAALVFNPSKIIEVPSSPLVIDKVEYLPRDARINGIIALAHRFAALLSNIEIAEQQIYLTTAQLFECLKLFALFTKHSGFHEEREWRIVYLRSRDVNKILDKFFHYWIGPRGLDPKLMFNVGELAGVTDPSVTLEAMLHKILIGPSVSSPIARLMVQRMLTKCGKGSLCDKVFASDIPYRAT
jgi:hypothetical protein